MWLNDTLHCVQWSLTRCSCSSRQPGGIKNCCSVHACKKAVKDKVRSHMISMTSWQDPQQTITDQSGAIFEPIPTFHYTWRRSLNLEAWLIVSSHCLRGMDSAASKSLLGTSVCMEVNTTKHMQKGFMLRDKGLPCKHAQNAPKQMRTTHSQIMRQSTAVASECMTPSRWALQGRSQQTSCIKLTFTIDACTTCSCELSSSPPSQRLMGPSWLRQLLCPENAAAFW